MPSSASFRPSVGLVLRKSPITDRWKEAQLFSFRSLLHPHTVASRTPKLQQLGRGPSPIPIVALFFYMIRIFLRPWDRMHEVDRSWTFVGLAVLLAVLIHVTLQVLLPLAVTRR